MITVDKCVFVSLNRMQLIKKVVAMVADDLGLDEVQVDVLPSADMDGCDGFCYPDSTIEIVNKNSPEQLVKTVAHEMRHAYQHKNGLICADGKWRDKCEFADGAEVDAYEYENVAWEKLKKSLTSR